MNRERPIIFSGPMVKAILEGQKTMTRRIVKNQPKGDFWRVENCGTRTPHVRFRAELDPPSYHGPIKCPYGIPGDRLYVKESYADVNTDSGPAIAYKSGDIHFCSDDAYPVEYERYPGMTFTMWYGDLMRGEPGHHWRNSMYMPRWASRILLEVCEVRVERLSDISEDDAKAEGVEPVLVSRGWEMDGMIPGGVSYQESFSELWESIHGDGAWEANPWVWCVSFRRLP